MAERFMTMLALKRPAALDADGLIHKLRESYPGLLTSISAVKPKIGQDDAGDMSYLLDVNGKILSVMFIDQPVPPGTYDNAIKSSLHWPQAAGELIREQAHVIVASLSEPGDLSIAMEQATCVALVSAELAKALPTIGVYWVSGETVTAASYFADAAEKIVAGHLPVEVWIQLGLFSEPAGSVVDPSIGAVTTGLSPFIGREIEFAPCAVSLSVLASRLIGTMQYLLTQGAIFKSGDTLGASDQECIRVELKTQGRRPALPVYALTLEQIDARA